MNKNFVADDNVTLFESLAIGNATVDEFTINTDAKKVVNTIRANKKLTESTATLSNKEKSFSGQMINVWDKLDNVSSVPEIISFVKDNFKDTPYKEKVLHNLKSKKNVMSAIGYLSSIVTKGDGITLNKGKQESLKEVLDEAIPRDLANAYKKYNINNINSHTDAMVDFENADYDEITPEEAIALKKAGQADQVIAKIGDNPVRFYDDGSVKLYRDQDADLNVRKNFGTLIKNADKIYKTNEEDKDLKQSLADKRNQKSAQRTLPSNKRDYYNDDREIERGTGVHREKDSETPDQSYLNRYKDALAKLNQQYEDGDISRKEYEATKASYEDIIKRVETRVKEHEKRVKERENERKQELMRGAETRNMRAPIDRFKEIKRSNTEAALAARNKEIEKASQDVEAKIKALEAQLAKLKADKQNDSNLRWATQRKNDLEKQLEKEQSDMAAIKSGKYVPESLQEEKCASVEARRHARVLKECMRKFFIDPEEDTEMYVDKDGTTHSLMELKCKWNGNPTSTELQNYATKEDWLADTLENMDYVGKDNTRLTEDINKLLPKVGKFKLITLTENNINNYDIEPDDFQEWWSMDGKVVKEVYSYERPDTDEQLPVVGVAYTDGTLAIIGLHTDKFVDSYDEMQSYLNKYAKLNESISLDEAIPKDLANALRSDRSQSINTHRGNSPDYQNREYTPIDIGTAMKMRREGRASEIEMVIGDNDHATFLTDGSVWENTSDVRNSFGSLARAASSIYVVSGDDKVAQEKRKARRDANSMKNYNKYGYPWSKVDTEFIDRGSGEHKKPSAQSLKRVKTAKEDVKQYEDRLAQLEASYESGDVSRNEYNTKKEQLLKYIESSKNWVDHITRELPSNKADEKRYGAQAKAMGSARARYQDIKKNPAERDVQSASQDIEKYKSAAVDKVAEKRKEIERLQREIEKLEADPESDFMTSFASKRLETAEAELEKQKSDLEKIKKGQYVPESLQEELENIELETEDDITNIELHDNGKLEISSEPKNIDMEEDSDNVIEEITEDELSELENDTEDFVEESSDNFNIEESFDKESGFNKSLNEGYAMTYDELVDSMNGNMSEEQIDKELLDHARIAAALGLGRKVYDLCIIPLDDNTLEYAPSYVSDGGAVEIIKQLKMVRENVEATLCTVNGIKVVEENIRNDIYLWFASEAEADNYEKAVVSIVDESSDITNKAITNAGLEIVKDEHGDYEVIAK